MTVVVPTGLEGIQESFATLGASLGQMFFKEEIERRGKQRFIRENPQIGGLVAQILDSADQEILDGEMNDPNQIAAHITQRVGSVAGMMGLDSETQGLIQLGEAFREARTFEQQADELETKRLGALHAEVEARQLAREAGMATSNVAIAEGQEAVAGSEFRQALQIPLLTARAQVQTIKAAGAQAELDQTVAEFKNGLAGEVSENFDLLDPELQELFAVAAVDPNVLNAMLTREGFDVQLEVARMQAAARTAAGIDPYDQARFEIEQSRELSELIKEFNAIANPEKGVDVVSGSLQLAAARINNHYAKMRQILGPVAANTYIAEARATVRKWGFDIVGIDVTEADVNPQLVSDPEKRQVLAEAINLGIGAGLDADSAFDLALDQSIRFSAAAESDPGFRAAFMQSYTSKSSEFEKQGSKGVNAGESMKNFLLSTDPSEAMESISELVGRGAVAIGQVGRQIGRLNPEGNR